MLLLLVAKAQAQTQVAYYSKSATVSPADTRTCAFGLCTTGVDVNAAGIANLSLAAQVYLPILGTTKLRLQLNGTAPAGYRAGMVLANGGSLLGLNALGAITLRTYLSTAPTTVQDTKVVGASAAQAQLVATDGNPEQLELISTKPFDQVEIEFAQALSLGTVINVDYAYGIGVNQAKTVAGYISRLPNQYSVSGTCGETITNPGNAADDNLNNYATMASLATVNCSSQLKVKLEGTAPSTYKAGFVVGSNDNLLNVGLLNSGLILRTYDSNGNLLESSSNQALIGLDLLPDGRSLVSFQATKAFSYVSIERTGTVTALDNLQLYYGEGVASTTVTPTVLSNFTNGTTHNTVTSTGVLCAACGVSKPENAAGSDNNSPSTVTVGAGVLNSVTLKVDLNGPGAGVTGSPGKAGNRAGMVIGNSSLIDADLLSSITLSTYDAKGNVIETAAGSTLLTLNVLPDGRRTVSFNSTKDFSQVSITIDGVVNLLSNTNVYYGFADDSNGQLNITNPSAPLPVSLTSFAVRRVAGTPTIAWTTASEVNSASFVVERSANPAAGFEAIGQVAAAGNSNTVHSYSLPDKGAATLIGTLYYRLRQIDADGTANLSPVAVLSAGFTKASFSIYPNPAPATAQQVTISTGTDLSAGYSVSLYSNMGQLLNSRVVSSEGAAAPLTISTAGLAAGMYHVVLRDAAGQSLSTQRLQVAGQ